MTLSVDILVGISDESGATAELFLGLFFHVVGHILFIYQCGMVRLLMCFFFFFSSRRRHTRFDCDWSSDVCSSDLARSKRPLASTASCWPGPRILSTDSMRSQSSASEAPPIFIFTTE